MSSKPPESKNSSRLTHVQMWGWSSSYDSPAAAITGLLEKLTEAELVAVMDDMLPMMRNHDLHTLRTTRIHAEQKRRQGIAPPAAAVGSNAVNGRV